MSKILLSLAILSSVAIAQTNLKSSDVIVYRASARDADNKKFTAEVELGYARIEAARAQYNYDRVSKVGEVFERSNAKLKLLQAQFAEKRAAFHIVETTNLGTTWRYLLDEAKNGTDVVQKLIKLEMDTCGKRIELLTHLKDDLEKYKVEVDMQNDVMIKLLASNAVTPEAAESTALAVRGVTELTEATNVELKKAKSDFDSAGNKLLP